VFLGSALETVFNTIAEGGTHPSTPGDFLGLGTPVLPTLPKHSGDRNRTSPFAFTGNKFEFRALGSSMSPSLPNTVLNTIVATTIDDLGEKLSAKLEAGADLETAVVEVVKDAYADNRQIVFDGDGYSEEWHAEAERRGLLNLRSTPDALPELVSDDTKAIFAKYDVLSDRELESRFAVFTEQYEVKVNIEAETAASIARTMILPAALRHLTELRAAGIDSLVDETETLVTELTEAIFQLEKANADHPDVEGLELAAYMRDTVIPAMEATRTVADKLERIVADDLWPLPKYQEMLFIK
jgi:glutamine synthetase